MGDRADAVRLSRASSVLLHRSCSGLGWVPDELQVGFLDTVDGRVHVTAGKIVGLQPQAITPPASGAVLKVKYLDQADPQGIVGAVDDCRVGPRRQMEDCGGFGRIGWGELARY